MSNPKINFKKLTIKQKDEIQKFTSQFEPYSDFNFVSLIVWDVKDQAEYAFVNGNLVIKIPDYYSDDLIVSIKGNNLVDETIEELLRSEKQLKLVPEIVIQNISAKEKFKITEEEHNHDYIYSLEKLSKLEGREYRDKRKHRNRFINNYGSDIVVKNNLNPIKYNNDIDKLLTDWGAGKANKHELVSEKQAIVRLIEMTPHLDITWTGLFVRNKLVGFSVNEVINYKYAICHFQKSLLDYKNSDIHLTTEASKLLKVKGCSYINWEQDMGSPGLRQSKTSYKPEYHLKKYSISLN